MSTPRINPTDPKWTAYVLGELDEVERTAVERLLETSAEARALVEELTTSAAALEEVLTSEPSLSLTSAQRAAVRMAADPHRSRWFAQRPMRWSLGFGVAAAAVLAVVLSMSRGPQQPPAPSVRLAANTNVPDTSAPATSAPAVEQTPQVSSAAPPAAGPAVASRPAPSSRPPAATAAPVLTVEEFAGLNTGATATTLTGAIRDRSGAVLPGAVVTAIDAATGAAISTVTDAEGRYTIDKLEPARTYRVAATLRGFQTASADLQVAAAGSVQRDFTMAVGALTETITVSGSAPVVDVQSAQSSPVFRGGQDLNSTARRAESVGGVVSGASPPSASPAPVDSFSGLDKRLGTESYARTGENAFVRAGREPLATFSIDVDTASYSNVRRFFNENRLPPPDAVRIEELVNYFTYDYARPSGPHPIGASMEVASAPWNPRHRLVRVGIKAREIDVKQRPASNLVFLIDVSGSMNTPQKLPLVKSGLKMLVDQLDENDVVSMVVYASATGLVLPPTDGERKDVIARAIDNLQAGGSTNGGAGIQLAYNQATANFIRGGVNRVILMTDGDFNVGITAQSDLTRLIEDRAKSGVFLSVLGFGMGNLKDSTMERLADSGNGHYAYIDTLNEARKVLVEEMTGTLVTVAKDVKIQVDFNPGKVEAYRLIGYENRALRPEDFNNDLKDAGDMGAGHTVTALFEVVPRGGTVPGPSVDPSVFQAAPRDTPPPARNSNDMLVLRVRYKLPEASDSTRMDVPLVDRGTTFADASADFRFAASVAAFGMILKNSTYRGTATLEWVQHAAAASQGRDSSGYRDEFVSLVQKAIALQGSR
jgi:Ca-activated chloride channel family protein